MHSSKMDNLTTKCIQQFNLEVTDELLEKCATGDFSLINEILSNVKCEIKSKDVQIVDLNKLIEENKGNMKSKDSEMKELVNNIALLGKEREEHLDMVSYFLKHLYSFMWKLQIIIPFQSNNKY